MSNSKWTVGFLLVVLATAGCKGKEQAGEAQAAEKSASTDKAEKSAKPAKAGLPTESETIALDEGKSEIPATITVPKGCTTFNDTPTTIRVDHGKMGELFGVQVKKGNEFNTNLEEFAGELAENKYGNTNKVLQKTDTLLQWSSQREGGEPNHKFRLLTKLGDTTWVCTDGNYGGWTKAQSERQIEACKTLAAKQ